MAAVGFIEKVQQLGHHFGIFAKLTNITPPNQPDVQSNSGPANDDLSKHVQDFIAEKRRRIDMENRDEFLSDYSDSDDRDGIQKSGTTRHLI